MKRKTHQDPDNPKMANQVTSEDHLWKETDNHDITIANGSHEKQHLSQSGDINDRIVVDIKNSKIHSETSQAPLFSLKTVIIIMALITLFLLYLVNKNLIQAHATKHVLDRNWYVYQSAPCSQPEQAREEMAQLAVDASKALLQLGENPVACYGTLLGIMRRGDVLPWDNNIDLCIVDRISKDFKTIYDVFSLYGIQISPYDQWNGHFYMNRNSIDGFITVFGGCTILDDVLFTKEPKPIENEIFDGVDTTSARHNPSERLCPDGTLPYMAQLVHGHTKPFPAVLLQTPLPILPFGRNDSLAIPRGDVEILKYFYPNSWWLEVKPVGC